MTTLNPSTAKPDRLAVKKLQENCVKASTQRRTHTHLPKVNVNRVLAKFRRFHAPLLNGEDTDGLDTRF